METDNGFGLAAFPKVIKILPVLSQIKIRNDLGTKRQLSVKLNMDTKNFNWCLECGR